MLSFSVYFVSFGFQRNKKYNKKQRSDMENREPQQRTQNKQNNTYIETKGNEKFGPDARGW